MRAPTSSCQHDWTIGRLANGAFRWMCLRCGEATDFVPVREPSLRTPDSAVSAIGPVHRW